MPNNRGSEVSRGPSDPSDPDGEAPEVVEVDPTGRYGRYDEVLGKGAFKTVYRAFDEVEGIEVAWNQVKVQDVLQSPEDLERLYSEVYLLKTLKHKNIIKFHNSWVDTKAKNVNFITEIFTSGTLRQYRKRHPHVDLKAVKNWSRQILRGLLYLHSHDPPIIHRDLKCDNIFVNGNQGEVKIGDLGLAAILRQAHAAHSVIGTPEFMAPELYEEEYNELVDIYSFGMCLLEMVTFEYPYSECTNPAQIYKKVTSGKKPAALDKVKDPEVRAFVERCLAPVSKRLPARELLNDPFLQSDSDKEQVVDTTVGITRPASVLEFSDDLPTIVEEPPMKDDSRLRRLDSSIGNSSPSKESIHQGSPHQGQENDEREPHRASLGFRVKGKRYDDDTIYLRLRIKDAEGHVRNIHFPFCIETDTALSVASEMVAELDLSDQDVTTISEMIDDEIQQLVPDWKPGVAVEEGSTVYGASETGEEQQETALLMEHPDDNVEDVHADDSGSNELSGDIQQGQRNGSQTSLKYALSPSRVEGGTVHGRFEEVRYDESRRDEFKCIESSDESDGVERTTNTFLTRKSPARDLGAGRRDTSPLETRSVGRRSPSKGSAGREPADRVSPSGLSSSSAPQMGSRVHGRDVVGEIGQPGWVLQGAGAPNAVHSALGHFQNSSSSLNAHVEAERNTQRSKYTHESWKEVADSRQDEGGSQDKRASTLRSRTSELDIGSGGNHTPPSVPHSPRMWANSAHPGESRSPPYGNGPSSRLANNLADTTTVSRESPDTRSNVQQDGYLSDDEDEAAEAAVREELQRLSFAHEEELRELLQKHEQAVEQAKLDIKNKMKNKRKGGETFDSVMSSPDKRSYASLNSTLTTRNVEPELFRDSRDHPKLFTAMGVNGVERFLPMPRPSSGPSLYSDAKEAEARGAVDSARLAEAVAILRSGSNESANGLMSRGGLLDRGNHNLMEDRGSGRTTPQPGSGYSSLDEGAASYRRRRDSDQDLSGGGGRRQQQPPAQLREQQPPAQLRENNNGIMRGPVTTTELLRDDDGSVHRGGRALEELNRFPGMHHLSGIRMRGGEDGLMGNQRRESVADQAQRESMDAEQGTAAGEQPRILRDFPLSSSGPNSQQGTPRRPGSPRSDQLRQGPGRWDRSEAASSAHMDYVGGHRRENSADFRRDLAACDYRDESGSVRSERREVDELSLRPQVPAATEPRAEYSNNARGGGRLEGATQDYYANGPSYIHQRHDSLGSGVGLSRLRDGGERASRDAVPEHAAAHSRDQTAAVLSDREGSSRGGRETASSLESGYASAGGSRKEPEGADKLKKQQLQKSIAELEAKTLEGLHSKNGFLSSSKKHGGQQPSGTRASSQPTDKT